MSTPKTAATDLTAHAATAADSHMPAYALLSVTFISVSSRSAVKEIRQFKETINKEALTVTNIEIDVWISKRLTALDWPTD